MKKGPEKDLLSLPETLPLLPVRDIVVFPYMVLPLFVSREKSIKSLEEALSKDRLIFLVAQKKLSEEDPSPKDLYRVGTVAVIMKMLKLPDGKVKILVQGLSKASIKETFQTTPYPLVRVENIKDPFITEITLETEALMRTVREQLERIVSYGKLLSPDMMFILESVDDPGRLADLVASNLELTVEKAQEILEILDPVERLKTLNELLEKEVQVLTMQAKIQSQAKEEITKTQKEYFLREQMRAIRSELGEVDERAEEIKTLQQKIKKSKMPKEVEKEARRELERLEQMHPDAAEASMVRTYLDWLIEMPWSISTTNNLDLHKAKNVLDEDHYDLEKVKERILEYLSVHKLKKKMKGPILCFIGPPGVGKTSLGRSIARALGRKFVRISLGGIRDEAEIRGHRRTYVGALPGRIIQSIKQAGSNNPVFMMDEVDKIGIDFRGDPASALLEVLDPEQNNAFSDHYLNVPFDLSGVMFITTGNLTDPIPSTLKDRMEVINLPGYTDLEKLRIARTFLLPRQMDENGISPKMLEISDKATLLIISQYTQEAGLRNLERELASICRKVARRIAEGKKEKTKVNTRNLHQFLGPPAYLPDEEQKRNEVGVATGLAWTETGGEILHVEASTTPGKGSLILTGHLGDVMKESAQAALTYVRSKGKTYRINPNALNNKEIHIHVPAGAIPKDGPSAGITMAVTLFSALTGIPVKKDVAMTGEITLRGSVLPVGGLKEKALAALRNKIKDVIIPYLNKKDLIDLPLYVRKKINFIPVKHMDEVLRIALSNKRVKS
ncbi:MAG: endopeptidase La [Deltaproteobacteria bacterium CG_4_8_14_3_um_filter_45_9]|nr:MAG: endopeptidase La [Deltaproteobacteria bacterium CG03_land_8_20_14_0_80_45_14]PIX21437.1 MAG: endopeptidase La [Deltaproteobacteria bacterium CG_4_8_14_3_um_filter_45_9]